MKRFLGALCPLLLTAHPALGAAPPIPPASSLANPTPTASGGTGAALTPAIGDLLVATSPTAFGRLADVATGRVLVSGGVGAAPAWSNAPVLGGAIGIGATTTPAVSLLNSTAATGAVPEQRSPAALLSGSYWTGSASAAMAGYLDLQYAASGNGPAPSFVFRLDDVDGSGISISKGAPFASAEINFPSSTHVYDGNVDIFRGDYGFGAETLDFENYSAGGGFVFGTSGPSVFTGWVQIGGGSAATASAGELVLSKITASGTAPGAGELKFAVVAGATGGSCKVIVYGGTLATPVDLINNVGTGC
jgi:hypothetical protein